MSQTKGITAAVQNSLYQMLAAFGGAGLNLILIFSYAKLLGPERYGQLASIQAAVIVWSMVIDLGLNNSLITNVTDYAGKISPRDFLFTALRWRLAATVLSILAIVFLSWRNCASDGCSWNHSFLFLAFTPHLIGLATQLTFASYTIFMGKHRETVLASLLPTACTVSICFLMALAHVDIVYLLFVQSLPVLLTGIYLYFYLRRHGVFQRKESPTSNTRVTKLLFKHAWPHAVAFASITLWQRMDQIAVSIYLSRNAQGQYAFVSRLISIPMLITAAVSIAIYPEMQRLGKDAPARISMLVGVILKLLFPYGMLVTLGFVLVLGLIVGRFYWEYALAIRLLPYFVPGIMAFAAQMVVLQALIALKKYPLAAMSNGVAVSVFLLTVFWSTKHYALMGTVASFNIFALTLLFCGLLSLYFCREFRWSFFAFWHFESSEREVVEKIFLGPLKKFL